VNVPVDYPSNDGSNRGLVLGQADHVLLRAWRLVGSPTIAQLDAQQFFQQLTSSRLGDPRQVILDPGVLTRLPGPVEARGDAVDPGLSPL
jgi:hypothetical protein